MAVCYGGYPGGDPRKFSPDPECSTDAEREAHRLACEAWDRFDARKRGEVVELPDPKLSGWEDIDGMLCHVNRQPYGLGVYEMDDDDEEYDEDEPAY